MAVIKFDAPIYSDAAYVEGVANRDERMERALHKHCKRYFDQNYRGVFFVANEYKDEIFQEAFLTLWEKIAFGKIYVEKGVLMGTDGKPFTAKLTTYFMRIAKLKYLEWSRQNNTIGSNNDNNIEGLSQEMDLFDDSLYDNGEVMMLEIISDCIAHMSKRCSEILDKFYYQEKTLDDIMTEIPEIESKDALKTRKYKCMEELRTTANSIYQRYLNA